jgi:rRNA-processing protein EBP2
MLMCRRKAREAKQYAKQVQAEKQKERNAAKKKQIDDVSKLRKQREKSVRVPPLQYQYQSHQCRQRQQPTPCCASNAMHAAVLMH